MTKWFLSCSTSDIAAIFGLSAKSVQAWVSRGCPCQQHGRAFRFVLPDVFAWWMENINSGQDTKEIEGVKSEYWKWKTLSEKLKAQEAEGTLIPRDQIAGMWGARILEVGTGLYALSSRLPPLVEGKTQAEAASVIKAEIRKLHENYSRVGRFCFSEEPKTKEKAIKQRSKLTA